MLCPVVPLCLHPAQLIPWGTWAPFSCRRSSAGKPLPTEQIFLPAQPCQPCPAFLSCRMAAGPGHGRRMLRAVEGARRVCPDPQGFLHPRYFAITLPGYAGFSCPGSCLCCKGGRGAGPIYPERAPAPGEEGEVSGAVGSRASPWQAARLSRAHPSPPHTCCGA